MNRFEFANSKRQNAGKSYTMRGRQTMLAKYLSVRPKKMFGLMLHVCAIVLHVVYIVHVIHIVHVVLYVDTVHMYTTVVGIRFIYRRPSLDRQSI